MFTPDVRNLALAVVKGPRLWAEAQVNSKVWHCDLRSGFLVGVQSPSISFRSFQRRASLWAGPLFTSRLQGPKPAIASDDWALLKGTVQCLVSFGFFPFLLVGSFH